MISILVGALTFPWDKFQLSVLFYVFLHDCSSRDLIVNTELEKILERVCLLVYQLITNKGFGSLFRRGFILIL